MNDEMETAATKQNLRTVGVIKKLSLNLVEKWRRIREANEYADKFYAPKLKGAY